MTQRFRERRVLYRDDLRNLCIKKQWYTRDDCAEYKTLKCYNKVVTGEANGL